MKFRGMKICGETMQFEIEDTERMEILFIKVPMGDFIEMFEKAMEGVLNNES